MITESPVTCWLGSLTTNLAICYEYPILPMVELGCTSSRVRKASEPRTPWLKKAKSLEAAFKRTSSAADIYGMSSTTMQSPTLKLIIMHNMTKVQVRNK